MRKAWREIELTFLIMILILAGGRLFFSQIEEERFFTSFNVYVLEKMRKRKKIMKDLTIIWAEWA